MARKKMVSQEEIERNSLEQELKGCREHYSNEPSIQYHIGDRVQRGSIEKSIITEILDGGKILFLDEEYISNNYGKKSVEKGKSYTCWHDVVPYIAPQDQPKQMNYTDDYQLQFFQSDIYSLLTKYYHFGINMEPDYQRGLVWTMEDKICLMDSIFNNIEIGKFVFCFTGYDHLPIYEILDGKQRLNTIIEFYESRLKYKGKTFSQLNWHDQTHFEHYHASIAENRNKMTREQKLRYFLKLNTNGRPQDPKHIAMVKELWENEREKK